MKHLPSMKQLQYLVALAEAEHFGRAARRCHVTQSTLSAGIRDLEAVLGTPVAERTNRQVLMTPIGRRLAARARALLRDAEDLVDLAAAARSPMAGAMHLGSIPTIGPFLLPRVLPSLGRTYPDLTLYLREEQTAPLLARLRDGELDAALIALPFDTAGLCTRVLFEDEFLFACSGEHELAGAETISIEALSRESLMLLEEGHCLRGHALDVCSAAGGQARAQFEASSLHTLVQMVGAGLGVTLLPKMAIEAGITRGTGISLSRLEVPASRQIGLAWRERAARPEDFRLLGEAVVEAMSAREGWRPGA